MAEAPKIVINDAPEIFLREIDSEHLEDVEENPEAVEFAVRLSETPVASWIEEFEIVYRQTPYLLKPPIIVQGDRMLIIFLPRYTSELAGFLKFLALIVRRANEELKKSEKLHHSNQQEQRKIEFRKALQQIKVPQS